MSKAGYYATTPQRCRDWMTPAEWGYWYEGKPAQGNLQGIDDGISVSEGEIRSGGTYQEKARKIAIWSMEMPAYDYILQRWYELILV